MKVLFLTISAGEGHNSMARAVSEYISNRAEVMTYDLFIGKDWLKAKVANEGYFFVCKYFYSLSNRWYRSVKKKDYSKSKNTVIHRNVRPQKKQVLNLINEYKPDVVFCTHVECACIMSDLKEEKKTDVIAISIITDFDVQPFTEVCTHIDYIIVPNEDFIFSVEQKGFRREQIMPFGIPVSLKFSVLLDKKLVRSKLNISQDKFTIFLMSGGIGFVDNEYLIKQFSKTHNDIQFICVCGKNKELKKRVDKMINTGKYPQIINYGYVSNVDELMSASDCIVGKAGSVTINESLNKLLPIVATEKLPWQEYYNMKYLEDRNAIIHIEKQSRAYEYVEKIKNDSQLLLQIKENMKKVRRPNAARDIGEFILGL